MAHTPEPLLHGLAVVLGDTMYFLSGRRRRVGTHNLHHAFPERPPAWHRRLCRLSCRRLMETALLSLAAPFLSERRLRQIARLDPSVQTMLAEHRAAPHPVVLGTAHLAYWEAQTWLGLLVQPDPLPEFCIIFRPLDNAALNRFMKETRERYGMRLLSKREGFVETLKVLRRRGFVGLLFDQHARDTGALMTLFGRLCSTTELAGLLVEKHGAELRSFYPRRRAFWRVEFLSDKLVHDGTAASATIALNRWLERTLAADDNLCASWLWTHNRWKYQTNPDTRFRLESKRDLVAADCAARGWTELPRSTRVWVRLPDDATLADQVPPLLRALRAGRPDAELTLVGQPELGAQVWPEADRFRALPPAGRARDRFFRDCRQECIDVFLVLAETPAADREAALTGARQRFGLVRPGQTRRQLTQVYAVPAEWAARAPTALDLWEAMLRRFGLQVPVERSRDTGRV